MDSLYVDSGLLREAPVEVLSLFGSEGMSALYTFHVQIGLEREWVRDRIGASDDALLDALLEERVSLRLGRDAPLRSGLVAEAVLEGPTRRGDRELVTLDLRVVPRLWLLSRRRNSRIFQGLYAHEIVSAVLSESGIAHRFALRQTYPRRIYCTQYQETDLEFVSRLLAEEGIFFFFDHEPRFSGGPPLERPAEQRSDTDSVLAVLGAAGSLLTAGGSEPDPIEEPPEEPRGDFSGSVGEGGATEVLVLGDQCDHYPPARDGTGRGLSLELQSGTGVQEHAVTSFGRAGRVRSKRVELRDYDYRRPLLDLVARAGVEGRGTALEVYDHHGEHDRPDVDAQNAAMQLEQLRARTHTCGGTRWSRWRAC